MSARRAVLRDALCRKMHALLSASADDADAKKAVDACWTALQRWADVSGTEYSLLSYRLARWKGRRGQALKILVGMCTKFSAKANGVGAAMKVPDEQMLRGELAALYGELGWDFLAENEKMGAVKRFPPSK